MPPQLQEPHNPFEITLLDSVEQTVFDDACLLIREITQAPWIQISFFDGQQFNCQARSTKQPLFAADSLFLQDTLQVSDFLEVEDCQEEPRYASAAESSAHKVVYYLGLPIIHCNNEPIGTVSIAADHKIVLEPHQRQAIAAVRNQCQYAIKMRQEQIQSLRTLGEQLEVQLRLSFEKKLSEKSNSKLLTLNKQLEDTNQQLAEANKQLQLLSTTDQMTQCLNRHALFERLTTELKRAARDHLPISLIMLDVDYFKPYNDHYGHVLGDQCLTNIAKALRDVLNRPTDIVARYGGEEFIYVLPNTNQDGAITIAEHVMEKTAELAIPHDYSQCSDKVTLSLGIASLAPDEEVLEINQFIDLADAALYQAKCGGRNQFMVAKREPRH